jgi:ABC-2 type transport system ATP-binding protein
VISVHQLTRTYGAHKALDSVSFEIGKGEVVGFLGPNGAGKTTTLRILAGYLPPTSGTARVAGFDVVRDSIEVRQRIGYLPESVPLYRELRVEEMLRFHARLHGMDRARTERRIGAVLEQVQLTERRRDLVGNLSRGLRQRAGLATALLPEPEVLILDEPTSGLDPIQRIEVRSLLQQLASHHTVIVSSHILPEIEAVCPRVIIVTKGRIAADGTREQLLKQLGDRSYVRLEAVVGPDVAKAKALLGSIAGVSEVLDKGRLGIHQCFDLVCSTDLREDAGAIAAARGWALRELSWRTPSLEQIFARIALGDGEALPSSALDGAQPAQAASAAPVELSPLVTLGPTTPTMPAKPPAPTKIVYNLNPFDAGAGRDLGKPKAVDTPKPPTNP